jgi:hypothetical protein
MYMGYVASNIRITVNYELGGRGDAQTQSIVVYYHGI